MFRTTIYLTLACLLLTATTANAAKHRSAGAAARTPNQSVAWLSPQPEPPDISELSPQPEPPDLPKVSRTSRSSLAPASFYEFLLRMFGFSAYSR